ncbi:MAG: PAS domain S-box protein [bacterium]
MPTEQGLAPELFKSVINRASDPLFILDPHRGVILDANEKAIDLLGQSRQDVIERSVSGIDNVLSGVNDLSELMEQLQNEDRVTSGCTMRWPDGTQRAVIDLEPISTGEREVVLATISRREDPETDLGSSTQGEDRYRTLFEKARVGIAEVSLDEEWLRVNERLPEMLGYTEEEFHEIAECGEINHPDELSRDRRNVEKLVNGEIDHFSVQKRYLQKNGEYLWTRLTVGLVEPEDGSDPYMVSIIEDISERKRLRREREAFFDVSLDMFAIADSDGHFLNVNQAFEDKFGYSEKELKSRSLQEFVHSEDRERTQDMIDRLQQEDDVLDFDNRFQTSEGDYRWLNWRVTAVDDLVFAAARDVTDRHRREQQLENTLREKKVLLGEIHHRVKNNLQVVNSILNMKKRDLTDTELVAELDSCINRIKSMALIHEKLYQSEGLDLVDLSQYLRDLGEHLLDLHGQENKNSTVNYNLDSQPIVLDKAIPCGLILNELLSNAIDYAYDNGQSGTIDVTFRRENSEGVITVEDNGKDLPEAVTKDFTSNFGLMLVKTLTEYELGGTLNIETGDGTRVELKFPLSEDE